MDNYITKANMKKIEEYYPNGQLKKRANFKEGKLEGLCESWYENGQLEERANFKEGILEGLYEKWYENGLLIESSNYKDGKLIEGKSIYK